jgi:hypothetical protein
MSVTAPIFTKLQLIRPIFMKTSYTEFHENPTNGIAADTMSQTDGSDVHIRRSVLLRKERRITGRREIHKVASNVTAIIIIKDT